MTNQATQNGTCQACGRQHAFDGFAIAKHGYTLEHGFFQGQCPGSDHPPLERNDDLMRGIVASLREIAEDDEAKWARDTADQLVALREARHGKPLAKRMTREERREATEERSKRQVRDRVAEREARRLREREREEKEAREGSWISYANRHRIDGCVPMTKKEWREQDRAWKRGRAPKGEVNVSGTLGEAIWAPVIFVEDARTIRADR
jgi:hypothetical protein